MSNIFHCNFANDQKLQYLLQVIFLEFDIPAELIKFDFKGVPKYPTNFSDRILSIWDEFIVHDTIEVMKTDEHGNLAFI